MPRKPIKIKSITNKQTGDLYVRLSDVINWLEILKTYKKEPEEKELLDEMIKCHEKLFEQNKIKN